MSEVVASLLLKPLPTPTIPPVAIPPLPVKDVAQLEIVTEAAAPRIPPKFQLSLRIRFIVELVTVTPLMVAS